MPPPDEVAIIEMRGGAPRVRTNAGAAFPARRRAGAFHTTDIDVDAAWHAHDMHQLLYAFEGSVELESSGRLYLLPAQQAAWIPAGVVHATRIRRVRSGAVFFEPDMVAQPGERVRILAAAPVIREMILYAERWPIGGPASVDEPLAERFFETLAGLAQTWIGLESPLCLPTGRDPVVRKVMALTQAALAGADLASICRSAGISERSLRRRFSADAGVTWRQYLRQSRLLHAMVMLGEPDADIAATAEAVGFGSLSAFAKAFREVSGETPGVFRRRLSAAQTGKA
jgi:AraC-like DNA-binding protein/mannose-6-phosphate isomerase-like protein (cupin superfamily)